MGVGGGFIMVPAMIYLLGMATTVVVGTSLFQIMFVTAATTMMHAIANHTVDAILALILLVGGVDRHADRRARWRRGCAPSSCASCCR